MITNNKNTYNILIHSISTYIYIPFSPDQYQFLAKLFFKKYDIPTLKRKTKSFLHIKNNI